MLHGQHLFSLYHSFICGLIVEFVIVRATLNSEGRKEGKPTEDRRKENVQHGEGED